MAMADHGSVTVTAVTLAFSSLASARPVATALPASSDPSVAIRICLYIGVVPLPAMVGASFRRDGHAPAVAGLGLQLGNAHGEDSVLEHRTDAIGAGQQAEGLSVMPAQRRQPGPLSFDGRQRRGFSER